MIALGRPSIGTEEVQLGAITQNDRVARQLNTDYLTGKGLNVGLENMCLVFRGRQENLVTTCRQRIDQRFTGEIVGRADLP